MTLRMRIYRGILQRRAESARPRHRLVTGNGKQQVQLLVEQLVVVIQRVAEQRKRLGERATSDHQLCPPTGEQIKGDEVLVHPYRIGGAQHRDSAAELDPLSLPGDNGQHDFGCRGSHVRTVVLSDPVDLQPEFVGQFCFLDHLPESLPRRGAWVVDFRECRQTEFHFPNYHQSASVGGSRGAVWTSKSSSLLPASEEDSALEARLGERTSKPA